jgi:hypothetical protein
MKERECDIQRAILGYLTLRWHFSLPTTSAALERDASQRFDRFRALGSPDIICIIDGKHVGIEARRPGGKQSEYQKAFQNSLELAGGAYILAGIFTRRRGHSD